MSSFHHHIRYEQKKTDKKITAEIISRRFSGMQHTIWGRNGKKLEDDLFVDVDPINYEPCIWYEKLKMLTKYEQYKEKNFFAQQENNLLCKA